MRSSTMRSRLSAVSWMHLPSGHTIMSGAWLQGNMHPVTVTRISVSRAWASLSFSLACRSAAPAALQRGPRHASRWCLKGGNSCQAGLRNGASDPVTARHSFDIVCPGRTAPAWTTTFGPSVWSRTHCPATRRNQDSGTGPSSLLQPTSSIRVSSIESRTSMSVGPGPCR